MKEKELNKFIMKLVEKYIPILCLERFEILVKSATEKEMSYHNNAEMTCAYPYLGYDLKYCAKNLLGLTKKEIEGVIAHELCHCLTDPLYVKATHRYVTSEELTDERERLTDNISQIVLLLVNKRGE